MSAKRFRIAFSFAGEKRAFVANVAGILASRFGKDAILYDEYHEAEFARARLGRYLPKLYHEESDLVAVVICSDYAHKEWCGLEWDAIFDVIKKRREKEVMLCRFDYATVEGLFSDAGFIELDHKTPEQGATLILERLALNEGKPKDQYLPKAIQVSETRSTAPGFWRWLLDRYIPQVCRFWARWWGGGVHVDPPEAQSYLRSFRADMENILREKTYVPLQARSTGHTALDDAPADDPFVWPIHLWIRELTGETPGGDSVNAQIAAVNRRSRIVRNLLRKLDRTTRPLILLGDPGSGKSMTLEQAGLLLAEREQKRAFPLIPVYVCLGDFHVNGRLPTPEDVMAHTRRAVPAPLAPHLDRLANEGRLVIFFDGMDEMSRDRYNDHTEALSLFASRYSHQRSLPSGIEGTKTLFSCRITDFSPRFVHERLVLLPFDRAQIRVFLRKYLESFPVEIEGRLWTLAKLSAHVASDRLSVDASNPLALWLLCVYLQGRKRWPDSRVEMLRFYNQLNYERKTDELRRADKTPMPPMEEAFANWGWIAFQITSRNLGTSIPVASLNEGPERHGVQAAIEAGKLCGVLSESKESYDRLVRFNHHRFQEFFAAFYIDRFRPQIHWMEKFDAPRWQETMFNLILMGEADAIVSAFAEEMRVLTKSCQDSLLRSGYRVESEFGSGRHRKRRGGQVSPGESADAGQALPDDSETMLADRVELASRILKQKSGHARRIDEILSSTFTPAVALLTAHGNPITQVKMLRACQNVPDIGRGLVTALRRPLNSQIAWVRNQALIVIASSKPRSVQTLGSDFATEIGFDLANGLFLRRLRTYWKAARRAKDRSCRRSLAAGLLCQVSILLFLLVLSAAMYAGAYSMRDSDVSEETSSNSLVARFFTVPVPHLDSYLLRWFPRAHRALEASQQQGVHLSPMLSVLGEPTAIAVFCTAVFLATIVSLSRDPPRLWLAVLGTSGAVTVCLPGAVALWGGTGWMLLSSIAALLVVAVTLVLTSFAVLAAHLACLSGYLVVTARLRQSAHPFRTFLSALWRSGAYDFPLKPVLHEWRTLLWLIPISVSWAWIAWLLCATLQFLSDFSHLPFHPLVNAAIVISGGLFLVLCVWSVLRRTARPLGMLMLALVGTAVIGGLLWLVLRLILWLPWASILRVLVVALVIALIYTCFVLLRESMKTVVQALVAYAAARRRVGVSDPLTRDDWIMAFTQASPYLQHQMLRLTIPQRLNLKPQEYLDLLKQIQIYVTDEPATSTYWDGRDKLEHALRQERRG